MEKATQHELQLARRMSRLGTETAFEVLNKARALERQGKSIIHLEIGEPDFDTPANVIDAGIDALRKGWTHYGPSAGLPGVAAGTGRIRQPHSRSEGYERRGRGGSRRKAHYLSSRFCRSSMREMRLSIRTPGFPSTSR